MTANLKTPLAVSLNEFSKSKFDDFLQSKGRALPCVITAVTGAIVTVKFEITGPFTLPQVKMPIAESVYGRMPIQVGDKGVALTGDVYLGGVSGLGGGVASFTQQSNLSTLIFFPIGSTAWPAVDQNAYTLTGVGASGVVLRSGDLSVTLTLTANGIAINLNGHSLTVTNGDVIADGISLKLHKHGGVQSGGGNTGPAIP